MNATSTQIGATETNTLTVNGGTLNFSLTGVSFQDGAYLGTINLDGATVTTTTGAGPRFGYTHPSGLINATGSPSTWAAPIWLVSDSGKNLTIHALSDLSISSVMADYPGLTGLPFVKSGSGVLTVTAVNTYVGTTSVSAGTLLVNGSLATGSAVTVASGATLGGSGSVKGPTTIAADGVLAPGSLTIGTLSIPNTLSLAGTTRMELSKSGSTLTHDKVTSLTTVTYGGTLEVVNISATALTAGDSFQLFSATTRNGSFSAIILPTLTTGLVWDSSALAATGTLTVAKGPQTITFGALSAQTFGDASFAPDATASSGLTVSYESSNPAVATISGNIVTLVGAGPATITATQAGDANYLPASPQTQPLPVNQAVAAITLENLAVNYNGKPKSAAATTDPTGLPVDFTYDGFSTPPTVAGSYAVIATINHPNYSGTTSGTLVISNDLVIALAETFVHPDQTSEYASLLNDGTLVLGVGSLHFTGDAINNGVMRLFGNSALEIIGSFTNSGTIDIINWTGTLPPTLVNHGIILDRAAVKVITASADATLFHLSVPGYAGHSYQLESSASLVDSWLKDGLPQLGTGVAANPPSLQFSSPLDGSRRFYRVVVTPAD